MKGYVSALIILAAIQNSTYTGLYEAAVNGDSKIFNELIATGANINMELPLHFAVYRSQKEVIRIFLEAGADVNLKDRWGRTPLHMACQFGDIEIAIMLVDAGADIGVTNNRDQTPLHVACLNGQGEIVQYLLSLHANIEKKDRYWGQRPLHLAVYRKTFANLQNVQILLAAGARIMAKNKYGGTPLHIASNNSFLGAIAALLGAGADPNMQDKYGETPLHKTSARRFIGNGTTTKDILEGEDAAQDFAQATEMLLKAGANPNVRDISGLTPFHYAAIHGLPEIALKLLKFGARCSLKSKKLNGGRRLTAVQAAEAAGENQASQEIKDIISRNEVWVMLHAFYDARSQANVLPLDVYQNIYEHLRKLPR